MTFSEAVEVDYEEALLAPRARTFKTYIPGKQYKVAIVSAENQVSPWGSLQVQLDVAAVDEDGNEVGSSRMWMTYPIKGESSEATPAETLQKYRDDMGAILRTQNKDFNSYGLVEGTGKNKKYYDKDGNELDAPARALALREGNGRIMTELKARQQDAQKWIGAAGFAKFVQFTKKSGKVQRQFQNFTVEPNDKLELITNSAEFFGE